MVISLILRDKMKWIKKICIHFLCRKYGIKKYKILKDLSLYVFGNVNFNYKLNGNLPLKFKIVTGNFEATHCSLTTMKGFPIYVGGYFSSSINKIRSMKYFPKYIGGDINISSNRIKSLVGLCRVNRHLDFSYNLVASLDGIPNNSVPGSVIGSYNILSSLENSPKCSSLFLDNNPIKTLDGLTPYFIHADFSSTGLLTIGDFDITKINRVCFNSTPLSSIKNLFDVEFMDYQMTYNFMRNGHIINKKRIEEALEEYGERHGIKFNYLPTSDIHKGIFVNLSSLTPSDINQQLNYYFE